MNPGQGKRAASKLVKLQAQCDAWNAAHPVGTTVVLTRDDDVKIRTETVSEAQVLSGHSAVIWMRGVRGCYLLDRVAAAADAVPPPSSQSDAAAEPPDHG
jgi:hypothetical protein